MNTQTATTAIDADLVSLARCGDARAREAIYRALASMVYTLARRMLASRSLAEDVLQETFIEVFTKLDELRADDGIRAWTKRIAVNKCLMHVRSSWVARRVEWDDEAIDAASADALRVDDNAALARALDALPHLARTVVWLHDVEGYTHKEIGALMGRSTSFSKSQLARAHERLRAQLAADAAEEIESLCLSELKTC